MNTRFKTQHLKRYRDIARFVWKYRHADLIRANGNNGKIETPSPSPVAASRGPEALAADLEKMGVTFIKLGQLLSSRGDLLPDDYIHALTRLQDKVKPFPFAEVEEIVQQELGARISKAFAWFDREPLAAASLGQVHRAALRDGRRVVVKVQRPHIQEQLIDDFAVLQRISRFFDRFTDAGRRYRFRELLAEFQATLLQELDYQREAAHLTTLADNLKDFTKLQIPLPVPDYTTKRVLTMDYVRGTKITDLSPLARLDFDGVALAEELFAAYLKQVLVDGLFHADPHPGNVFLTNDGRVALLDLGMIGRTTPGMQEQLLKVVLAMSEGHSEEIADIVVRISETTDDFDQVRFYRKVGQLVAEQCDSTLQNMDIGKTLLATGRAAGETGLYVPPELTLLGKTLFQLHQIGQALDPGFDPNASIRRHASEILKERLRKNATAGNLLGSLLELKEFAGHLPSRLNKILDAVANAEVEVNVKAADIDQFMEGFQKIANRIATGLVLAALIVGAALLMQVETSFRILGYPGFAMLCFLGAAAGGFWLVLSSLIGDHRRRSDR